MSKTFASGFFKWSVLALTVMLTTMGIFANAYAQGGDVSRGKQLFQDNCAVCHGANAEGRVGARLAKDFPGIRVDALLQETISNGVQGSVMPAWSQAKGGPLNDQQIGDLVAFIRSLGHQAPPVTPNAVPTVSAPPPVSPAATFPPGDSQRGSTVFTQNCAVCHGDKGQGRIGATLAKDWPGVNPETAIEATISRGVAGSKMPAWGKANGGPLTDQEIADAASFIRTLKQPGAAQAPAPSAPQVDVLGSPLVLLCGGLVLVALVALFAFGLAGARPRR